MDRIEWIWIPDAQTQVNALLNGEVDMIESVAHDLLAAAGERQERPSHSRPHQQPVRLPHELAAASVQRCESAAGSVRGAETAGFPRSCRRRSALLAHLHSPLHLRLAPGNRSRHGGAAGGQCREGQGNAAGGRLRRHAHRAAAILRRGRADEPGSGGQGPARACRLQGRHADHGLAKPGQSSDHQEGACVGGRMERLCDELGAARYSRSA